MGQATLRNSTPLNFEDQQDRSPGPIPHSRFELGELSAPSLRSFGH